MPEPPPVRKIVLPVSFMRDPFRGAGYRVSAAYVE
jgi:hypothetical protein